MSCSDPASYVLLLQIVRRRSTEEVKGLIRPPLPLPEAIERVKREVCRWVHGCRCRQFMRVVVSGRGRGACKASAATAGGD
eukprot:1142354-Pelagomonas_calceolata.AAC.6